MNSLGARTEGIETHQLGELHTVPTAFHPLNFGSGTAWIGHRAGGAISYAWNIQFFVFGKSADRLRNAGVPAGEYHNNILSSMFSQFLTRREEMHNNGGHEVYKQCKRDINTSDNRDTTVLTRHTTGEQRHTNTEAQKAHTCVPDTDGLGHWLERLTR